MMTGSGDFMFVELDAQLVRSCHTLTPALALALALTLTPRSLHPCIRAGTPLMALTLTYLPQTIHTERKHSLHPCTHAPAQASRSW